MPRSRCGASRYWPSARFSMVAPNWRSTSKWKSIGRPPMSQPPRPGMKAWPRRCSSGPQKRIGMRDEPAWASMSATFALSTCEGSRMSSPGSSPGRTVTPCSCSSPRTTRTSRMSGTLRSRLGPLPSSAATIAFGTRFLAPRTRISPSSGVPPWTSRTSSVPVMNLAFRSGRAGGHQKGNGLRPSFSKAPGGVRTSPIRHTTFCSPGLAEGHRPYGASGRPVLPCPAGARAVCVRPELRTGAGRDRAGHLCPAESEDAGSSLP